MSIGVRPRISLISTTGMSLSTMTLPRRRRPHEGLGPFACRISAGRLPAEQGADRLVLGLAVEIALDQQQVVAGFVAGVRTCPEPARRCRN